MPEGVTVASFAKYPEAVDAVDALIRHDFPAPLVSIVGSNLRSVERVRSRLSYSRIAIRGLITGSWVGLLYWLVFGGSSGQTSGTTAATAAEIASASLLPSIIIGAGVGMLFSVIRFSLQRRNHEFLSMQTLVASNYDVVVPSAFSDQANKALAEHREKCVAGHNH